MCVVYMQILCHFILGLERPQILVSVGSPGTNPPCILRDNVMTFVVIQSVLRNTATILFLDFSPAHIHIQCLI